MLVESLDCRLECFKNTVYNASELKTELETLTQSFCEEVVGKHEYDLAKFELIHNYGWSLEFEKFYKLFQDAKYRHNATYTFFRGSRLEDSIISTLPKEILTIICRLASPEINENSSPFDGYEISGTNVNLLDNLAKYLSALHGHMVNSREVKFARMTILTNVSSVKMEMQRNLVSTEDKQRKISPKSIIQVCLIFSVAIISEIGLLAGNNNTLKV
jgi:hypothetical protein